MTISNLTNSEEQLNDKNPAFLELATLIYNGNLDALKANDLWLSGELTDGIKSQLMSHAIAYNQYHICEFFIHSGIPFGEEEKKWCIAFVKPRQPFLFRMGGVITLADKLVALSNQVNGTSHRPAVDCHTSIHAGSQ